MINGALKDVQTSLIDDHKFLVANRELSEVELKSIKADADREYWAEYNAKDALYKNALNKYADYKKLEALHGKGTLAFRNACIKYGIPTTEKANTDKIAELEKERDSIDYDSYYDKYYYAINTVVDDGSIVYVKYDNGHWFVLNYNDCAVTVVSPVDGTTPIKVGAKSYFDSNANA